MAISFDINSWGIYSQTVFSALYICNFDYQKKREFVLYEGNNQAANGSLTIFA